LTDNPKERFLISEFIDYLELLGLVADFRGFQTSDIKSNNFQKLHKFLLCVSKQISDSELREYNGDQKLFFKDVLHSNLWIEFAEEALTCTIVRGEFSFPRDYDRFYQTITDTTLNSGEWITKHQIMERFTDEIREHGGDLDSQGMFPNLDTDSLLQYCYLSVEVGIPERRLVGTSVSNLVEFFRSLLGQLHRAILKIDEAVYPGPASG
jgi:hypothetical protein